MKRGLIAGVSKEVKKLEHSNFADTNDNGTATLKTSLGVGKSSEHKALMCKYKDLSSILIMHVKD